MAIIYDNNTPIFNGLSGLYTNVILSGGNVGVGTSTPNALLAVGNAATRGTVTVNGSTAAAPYFQLLEKFGIEYDDFNSLTSFEYLDMTPKA